MLYDSKALGGSQLEAMNGGLSHRRVAEHRRNSAILVPGGELISVIRAQIVTRLADGDIHQRIIEIRQVGDKTHRRRKSGRSPQGNIHPYSHPYCRYQEQNDACIEGLSMEGQVPPRIF